MGSSFSLTPDAESPTEPGKLVVLSSELEGCSREEFIEALLDILRRPVQPFLEPALKNVDLVEHDENSFTVKVVLDGAKLESCGYGDGTGRDRVSAWMKTTYRPAEGLIVAESYVMPSPKLASLEEVAGDRVRAAFVTRVLKRPLRIEYWWELDGERQHGPQQARVARPYLDSSLAMAKARLVSVADDCHSLAEPGKSSVISAPLDEHIDVDALWYQFLDFPEIYKGEEITQVSENEVAVTGPGGSEPKEGARSVRWDRETGRMVTTLMMAGKVQTVTTVVVHERPLRVEAWQVNAQGERRADQRFARMMEVAIDSSIQRHKACKPWF